MGIPYLMKLQVVVIKIKMKNRKIVFQTSTLLDKHIYCQWIDII